MSGFLKLIRLASWLNFYNLMNMNYATITQFIDCLKLKKDVVGIVEYGGRTYSDMSVGGDYDLTVITRSPVAANIGGVHFHIAGIPIDCMILSTNDFKEDNPKSPFWLVHLNCKILFDRDNITKDLLNSIQSKWQHHVELTEREIGWFRFIVSHVIDKLKNRLQEDVLYSNYFMSSSLELYLACYARIKKLEAGKPKLHFQYMKENDVELYGYFNSFYETTDVSEHFSYCNILPSILPKILAAYGKKMK